MIQEILSNSVIIRIDKEYLRIPNFSPEEKSMAQIISDDIYQSHFEDGVYTEEDISFLLQEIGIWTDKEESNLNKQIEILEQMKIDYYDNFFFASRKEKIKRAIHLKNVEINDMYSVKNYLRDYTCESAKNEAYFLSLFSKYENPSRVYKKYASAIGKESDLRDLYFNNTWRLIWSASKEASSIFGLNLNYLNDNQLILIYWSKLYDSIYESTEAPPSDVIKDQIAVDGWLAKQAKKRAAEQKGKVVEDSKCGENFVMVSNRDEAKELNRLNSLEGLTVIKSRVSDLKKKGDLDEFSFSHVQQDIAMEFNKMRSKK
jgi:hypothetical protein